jgi:tetratricopeptide (TPR) repeat protein
VIAANADIVEEVELGRTLLSQGHLETAQKVLLKVCQAQPESSRALRALAEVLQSRGDDKRAGVLVEYADELDGGKTAEIRTPVSRGRGGADSRENAKPGNSRPDLPAIPPPGEARVAPSASSAGLSVPIAPPKALVVAPMLPETPLSLPSPSGPFASSVKVERHGRRRGLALLLALVGVLVVALAVVGYAYRGRAKPARPSPREELDRALVSGALEVLMRARELARMGLDGPKADPDDLVRLGLVNALLASDYAMDSSKDAEESLARAEQNPASSKERLALAAAAKALLALAARDRITARAQADLAVALNAPDPPAYALLASARTRIVEGDGEGAGKELDLALGKSPELIPVVVDWAASRIDGGDPVLARRTLLAALGKSPDNSRARLVLADAERALGEPGWSKRLETACGSDGKISRAIRSTCAVELALQARLEGDRAAAVRKAKAVAQSTDDGMLLGQLSLLLAVLGEIDVADEVLQKAEKGASRASAPLQWAGLAIRLGRAEEVPPSPILEHAAGPERDLVALRAAYAHAGSKGLAEALKGLPPGILDIDWDVRALALLAHEGLPPKLDQIALEKKGDKGNPVAAYVLGRLALQSKDYKLAARRLERAFSLHGDACRAATLYLEAFQQLKRGAVLNKAGLRAVRARNTRCPLPET